MHQDIMRFLCNAVLKASGGEPVVLTNDEAWAGFELSLKDNDGSLTVHVVESDDDPIDEDEIDD